MAKKLLYAGLVMLAVALVGFAADSITGKWVYEQAGRQGGTPRRTTLDLKAEGPGLTGTITQPGFGRRGGGPPPASVTTPISNGKVEGNNISFEVTREFPGNSVTTKYDGVVSGDEMKLKITMPGFQGGEPRVFDVVAKKQ